MGGGASKADSKPGSADRAASPSNPSTGSQPRSVLKQPGRTPSSEKLHSPIPDGGDGYERESGARSTSTLPADGARSTSTKPSVGGVQPVKSKRKLQAAPKKGQEEVDEAVAVACAADGRGVGDRPCGGGGHHVGCREGGRDPRQAPLGKVLREGRVHILLQCRDQGVAVAAPIRARMAQPREGGEGEAGRGGDDGGGRGRQHQGRGGVPEGAHLCARPQTVRSLGRVSEALHFSVQPSQPRPPRVGPDQGGA
mmetsp:Transcript_36372/g.84805  ORF Transcript_36372/g.84805 Transcript_36372/m.84805 type:complete len:253 (+) Transcript_36372:245-1003(+)